VVRLTVIFNGYYILVQDVKVQSRSPKFVVGAIHELLLPQILRALDIPNQQRLVFNLKLIVIPAADRDNSIDLSTPLILHGYLVRQPTPDPSSQSDLHCE
jgi:hypothetical protein